MISNLKQAPEQGLPWLDAKEWQAVGRDLLLARQENKRLRATLLDMREHGTRFDLNPTMAWKDEDTLALGYLEYIKRIDEAVRKRAAAALETGAGHE